FGDDDGRKIRGCTLPAAVRPHPDDQPVVLPAAGRGGSHHAPPATADDDRAALGQQLADTTSVRRVRLGAVARTADGYLGWHGVPLSGRGWWQQPPRLTREPLPLVRRFDLGLAHRHPAA